MSNTQHKLDKVRPPRVQITYDVEIDGSQSAKELPLVIGVLGDFTQAKDTLRERKFLNINKDNFNRIMTFMNPEAHFLVESVLPGDVGQLAISLTFQNMEDFSPDSIVNQIEPLRRLKELREQLSDLRNRVASNQRLKEQLEEISRQQIKIENSTLNIQLEDE